MYLLEVTSCNRREEQLYRKVSALQVKGERSVAYDMSNCSSLCLKRKGFDE